MATVTGRARSRTLLATLHLEITGAPDGRAIYLPNKDAGTRLRRLHRGHDVVRSERPVTRSEEGRGVNQAKYAAALLHRFVFSHDGPEHGGRGTGV
jgi:hypothetical protein